MYKRGVRIKFLPRGASKYTPPPPSPQKCLLPKMGGRGGGYIISPWNQGAKLFEAAEDTREFRKRATKNTLGCVVAQAFFSRGVSAISLKARVFSAGLSVT